MVQQRVDQSPVAVAGRRMDHQSGRLVDHQQMLVLEDDRQRDILRLVMGWRGIGHRQREAFVAFDLGRRVAKCLAVAGQSAGLGQDLQPFPRQGRDCRGKCPVQPPTST